MNVIIHQPLRLLLPLRVLTPLLTVLIMGFVGCDTTESHEHQTDQEMSSNPAGVEAERDEGSGDIDFGAMDLGDDSVGGMESPDMSDIQEAGMSSLTTDLGPIEAGESTAGASLDEESMYQPYEGPITEGEVVLVSNVEDLLDAINNASPGEVITLEPGVYQISQLVRIRRDGEEDNRIFLRAAELGQVTLELSHIENFKIYAKFWVFENLRIIGVCQNGQGCEHAFHIVGDADDLVFRNNEVIDFASHVKLNAELIGAGPGKSFPDRTLFLNNMWYNTRYIRNNAPHNILNIDGGVDHVVRGNLFADYSTPSDLPKSASAIYPKASTRRILIEQNLIVCEKQRLEGETTRGIQLGDGAPPSICDGDDDQDGNGDCLERGQSQEAIVRNNIIIGCNNGGSSTGIMVGSDRESLLLHNTVVGAGRRNAGFYQGHPNHDTYWQANILEGGINVQYAERSLNEADNLTPDQAEVERLFDAPFEGNFTLAAPESLTDQIPTNPNAPHDFCGHPRGPRADIGAIEYSTSLSDTSCVERILMMFRRIP